MAVWQTWLATFHRYLGIGLCLLFAMWFASGIVMLFHPYPALSAAERVTCSSAIDVADIEGVAPLLAHVPVDASGVRLTAVNGRALLHVHRLDSIQSWWADSGEGPVSIDLSEARRVGRGCGWGNPVRADTIRNDQWIVHQRFDPDRPLHRVELDDAAGTVVYVSSRTGEVVQKTTRSSRFWNWIGSVPHWIYPTIIRRDWALWDALVWWLSGAGTVGVLAGLAIGVVRWRGSPWSRISPFRGAMYWHHVTGLGVGMIVLTWTFSGMMSMDHGRLFSTGIPSPSQLAAVTGPSAFAGDPASAVHGLADAGQRPIEVEWVRVAGLPFVIVRRAPGQQSIVRADGSLVGPTFTPAAFDGVATKLLPDARIIGQEVLDAYDAHYYGREHAPRPLPVLRLRYDDPAATWIHVDLATGAILDRVDGSRRAYRYWFNALHSHDLPWMLDRPATRRTWMIALCAAGFLFSCNGVWLAWKRLRPRRLSGR